MADTFTRRGFLGTVFTSAGAGLALKLLGCRTPGSGFPHIEATAACLDGRVEQAWNILNDGQRKPAQRLHEVLSLPGIDLLSGDYQPKGEQRPITYEVLVPEESGKKAYQFSIRNYRLQHQDTTPAFIEVNLLRTQSPSEQGVFVDGHFVYDVRGRKLVYGYLEDQRTKSEILSFKTPSPGGQPHEGLRNLGNRMPLSRFLDATLPRIVRDQTAYFSGRIAACRMATQHTY